MARITKDEFSPEVYEEKAEKIFFSISICSTIDYGRKPRFY